MDKTQQHGRVKTHMSFYDSTLDREQLKNLVEAAPSIDYTHGLRLWGPATLDVEISVEKAIEIVKGNWILDAGIYDDGHVSLNTFSDSDLF